MDETKITRAELCTKIRKYGRKVDIDVLFQHLAMVGAIIPAENDTYQLTDCFEQYVQKATGPIVRGDIVFVMGSGFLLVLDTKPAAANDGNHFRGMRVSITDAGSWKIEAKLRSQIYDNYMTLKFASSSFNMDEIERYSYDRYLAYNQIQKINQALSEMRG